MLKKRTAEEKEEKEMTVENLRSKENIYKSKENKKSNPDIPSTVISAKLKISFLLHHDITFCTKRRGMLDCPQQKYAYDDLLVYENVVDQSLNTSAHNSMALIHSLLIQQQPYYLQLQNMRRIKRIYLID